MRRSLSYRVFLSEGLKDRVLELIEQFPPEINNFKRDKLFYILSLICEIPARNKRNGESLRGYTNINATLLRTVVYDYKRYIEYLMKQGVIVCDGCYKPGEKSLGYKLRGEYVGKVKPAYIQNPELLRKLKRNGLELIIRSKKYKHLKKWFDDLEIDFKGAYDYIIAQYAMKVMNPELRDWDAKRERFKEPIEQYNAALVNLYYLKDRRISFFVDDNVGRLHTNLTNIQSDLRNFITWKGQKLVSIDISNSQPFLSTLLFRESFYNDDSRDCQKFTLSSFSGELSLSFGFGFPFSSFSCYHNLTYSADIANTTLVFPPLMLQKPPQLTEQEDVKLFLELVEKGQLYEYLKGAFGSVLGTTYTDKKRVKAAVFQVLFTDNRFLGQEEAAPKKLFKKIFPNVYKLFAAYKKGDATVLPRLLQKIEARIILDVVAKRISRERPKAPIFTIHDSITTTVENVDFVKMVMRDELERVIGIIPNLKVERWEFEELDSRVLEMMSA